MEAALAVNQLTGGTLLPSMNARRGSTASNASNMSVKSTNSNKSRQSLSSRASNFFRFRSSSRSRESKTEMQISEGDHCETISVVTVRTDEALESDVIEELPIGTALEIIEIGELPRRAKMVAGSITGWISVKTRLNEPLITKRAADLQTAMADFEVGGVHEVQSLVTLRALESLDSEVITELKPGTLVKIRELGTHNKRRGKVETDQIEGWISLTTRQGELLIGKVSHPGSVRASQVGPGSGFFGTSSNKIKVMLESARCGDLDSIKRIVEGNTGFMGKLSGRPNLNCSDIRGKTALIYAAAFGNKAVMEYLLTKKHEVDVNCYDDTSKTALHHASKRARKCRTEYHETTQVEIIDLLLGAGAVIEARDHNGCTPLMFAVANGDEPVSRALLKAGANVNVKDYEGHTPLDYANNFGYGQLAKELKSLGGEGNEEWDLEDQSTHVAASAVEDACATLQLDTDSTSIAASSPAAHQATKKKLPKRKSRQSVATPGTNSTSADASAKVTELAREESPAPEETARPEDDGDGDKKAKTKAKAKAKVKGKAKAKGKAKVKTSGMAVMVAEMEGEGDVPVEVLDLKEEADDKELAQDKLKAILASSSVVSEIEGALNLAKAAGVEPSHLAEAEAKLKKLREKATALERLRSATDSPEVGALEASIAEAEKLCLPSADIEKAKAALQIERPKQNARDLLKKAQDAASAADLKAAIAAGKTAQLTAAELAPFEDLLKGAESKDKAIAALKDAMESRDIAQLKFSINQAKEAGVDQAEVAAAETILKEEEPKAKARESIADAMEKVPVDVPALEAAIAEAKAAKLDPYEYSECVEMVRKEAEKAKAFEEVKKVNEATKETDMTSIDAITEAKKKLHEAIIHAKDVGVPEASLNDFELRRRKLHNAIEDLKGSIRVFCRVRPLSSTEKTNGDENITKPIDGMTVCVTDKNEQHFIFDAVFTPGTQEQVFEDCRDLVQSAADGYNVTLFAYGQTGAGKTYTMGGTPENPGVSRRTIEEVFRVTEAGSSRYTYTVMGSMLELYRQDLNDLLAVAQQGKKKLLQVKTDKSGAVVVDGLTEMPCKNPDELSDCLEMGISARKVMATSMNSESSRSHLLFICKIVSVNRETQDKLYGKILIVDLAGSERLSKSQVSGDGAKEAIEINKSLTALGDVIEALTKNSKQIPYRNHKLTQVMQDSIGGSAKTLMFVNISPASSNADETIMSLKYATRAKKITNNTKKN